MPSASPTCRDPDADSLPPGSLLESLTDAYRNFTPSPDFNFAHGRSTITQPTGMHTISRIVCQPRVCGVFNDTTTVMSHQGLVDGGANINITNDISILTDVQHTTPFQISVAVNNDTNVSSYCTHYGNLPLSRDDGQTLNIKCYYCPDAVETIISPTAVLASSTVFCKWTQLGFKDTSVPGYLKFSNATDNVSMTISLISRNGLYYCQTTAYVQDSSPLRPTAQKLYSGERPTPTTKARQIESELWLLRFGSPCESQLHHLPSCVTGTPTKFEWHPFLYIDFKEQAYARKQPVNKNSRTSPGMWQGILHGLGLYASFDC